MERMLIFVGSEILPAELDHLGIVDPDEGKDGESDEIDDGDVSPEERPAYVLDGEDGEGISLRLPDVAEVVRDVDGEEDGAGEEGDDDKHVAAHGEELEEADCVESDRVDEGFLLGRDERLDPGEEALGDAGRGLALLGVLALWLVDDRIIGTKGGEADYRDEGDRGHEAQLDEHRAGTACVRCQSRSSRRRRAKTIYAMELILSLYASSAPLITSAISQAYRPARAGWPEQQRRSRRNEKSRSRRTRKMGLRPLLRADSSAASRWALWEKLDGVGEAKGKPGVKFESGDRLSSSPTFPPVPALPRLAASSPLPFGPSPPLRRLGSYSCFRHPQLNDHSASRRIHDCATPPSSTTSHRSSPARCSSNPSTFKFLGCGGSEFDGSLRQNTLRGSLPRDVSPSYRYLCLERNG